MKREPLFNGLTETLFVLGTRSKQDCKRNDGQKIGTCKGHMKGHVREMLLTCKGYVRIMLMI